MRRTLLVMLWSGAMALVVSGVPPAGAATAPTGTAQVRVAHLSPDTPGVDVWVDGQVVLKNVNYQTASNYLPVPAGQHLLELRPAGAPATAKAALATTQNLEGGHAYTVAGVGPNAKLGGMVLADDLSAPPTGEAKVRAIHTVVGIGGVDAKLLPAGDVGDAIAFAAASPYATITPGRYTLVVSTHADNKPVLDVPNLDVGAGIVYSIAAIGGAGKPVQVLPLVDVRAPQVLPAGALRTGLGGTATRPGSGDTTDQWLLGGAAALVVLVGSAAVMRRRRVRSA